jgi:aryl-alcohol dehydrogenase-like predicted oxidoreductase
MIDDGDAEGATRRTGLPLFFDAVVPAYERLKGEGLIGAWGITGVMMPSAIIKVLESATPPEVVQCIANLLDSPGGMRRRDEEARPREIIAAAKRAGVGVMGIRAVQAGALTSGLDRELPPDHPEMADYHRAEPFPPPCCQGRRLARLPRPSVRSKHGRRRHGGARRQKPRRAA